VDACASLAAPGDRCRGLIALNADVLAFKLREEAKSRLY